jgi:hypothetical protein
MAAGNFETATGQSQCLLRRTNRNRILFARIVKKRPCSGLQLETQTYCLRFMPLHSVSFAMPFQESQVQFRRFTFFPGSLIGNVRRSSAYQFRWFWS